MLRIFKLSRYVTWLKVRVLLPILTIVDLRRALPQLLSGSIANSIAPLGMSLFITLIGTLVFSALMYYVERGEWNEAEGRYYMRGRPR